jgi:Flp pilus assembly protein TadD
MFNRAVKLFQKRELSAAEELCRSILASSPEHSEALGLSGVIALMSGRPADAEQFLNHAVALTPNSYDNLSNLGTSYVQLGRFEDAVTAYKSAVAQRPNQVSARLNLATAYKALHQYDQALAQLRPFIAARDPALHLEFAELSMLSGDIQAGVKSFRKVVAATPDSSLARHKLADALQRSGEFQEAVKEFRKIAERAPSDMAAQADLGTALVKAGAHDDAIVVYRRIVDLDPSDAGARARLGQLFRDRVPAWHFTMLGDEARNTLYDSAIRAAIRPGDVVLDIGTGSGLLAMMAARAGAAHVYACEAESLIAAKARDIVAKNGLSERITVIAKKSTDLRVGDDLPAKADVLLSEIVDVELLGEGIIETLDHALAELAVDGAHIIPSAGAVYGMMVESEELYRQDRVHDVLGFDLGAFNEFSCFGRFTTDIRRYSHEALSAPVELFRFDFTRRGIRPETRRVDFQTLRAGICHGTVMWFELILDNERRIDASPMSGGSHWMQMVQLLEHPRAVAMEQTVSVETSHDRHHVYISL